MKPCPFCGEKPYLEDAFHNYEVACHCGASGPDREKRKDAIDAWDKRPIEEGEVTTVVTRETFRDRIARSALPGVIATNPNVTKEAILDECYRFADSFIARKNKGTKKRSVK
jgi:Lar family restriction alleviation protein